MGIQALVDTDFSAWVEPDANADPRELLESWFRYQRHEFIRKLRDLSAEQLVSWSIPPVELSVLGLVRHMTQMEQHYVAWGLLGGDHSLPYGEDDCAGGSVESLEADLGLYFAEVKNADAAIAAMPTLDSGGEGHGRPCGGCLSR
jgi:hypothetical protein